MSIPVRFVIPWGKRVWLRIFWGEGCPGLGCHNAMALLGDFQTASTDECPGGQPEDYAEDRWPVHCEDCAVAVPPMQPNAEPRCQVFRRTLYVGSDGGIDTPRVGDCYWVDWYDCDERGGNCIYGWTNCDGRHLFVHLPNPRSKDPVHDYWDVMGRASNCDKPDETTHRCWVLHGTPEAGNLHVDKAGHTCNAGAGSIDTGRWHGVLHNGQLT